MNIYTPFFACKYSYFYRLRLRKKATIFTALYIYVVYKARKYSIACGFLGCIFVLLFLVVKKGCKKRSRTPHHVSKHFSHSKKGTHLLTIPAQVAMRVGNTPGQMVNTAGNRFYVLLQVPTWITPHYIAVSLTHSQFTPHYMVSVVCSHLGTPFGLL